jgi:hypothetical protein
MLKKKTDWYTREETNQFFTYTNYELGYLTFGKTNVWRYVNPHKVKPLDIINSNPFLSGALKPNFANIPCCLMIII